MTLTFRWESPSSQRVLTAALDALADLGPVGLTAAQIRDRAGSAGRLVEDADLEEILVVALQQVRLFTAPPPTGSLRGDLRALLDPWLGARGRNERVVAAVLSLTEWNPRLKEALREGFDRPLALALGELLARALRDGEVSSARVQTLNWILRGLALTRLRAIDARTPVDLDALIDHLVAGLAPKQGGD
jgi:hypothetical protein